MTLRVLTLDNWPLWRTVRLAALTDAPLAFRVGLTDRLVAELEAWAVRSGAPTLRLAVFGDNAPAVALYERHGYVPQGEADGQLVMVKTLP